MLTFCSLFSGSSGNAIYLANNKTKLLIDCGVSGKKVAASLINIGVDASEIDAILVTHEHKDHINAVGIMSRRYNIPIYANEKTWEQMETEIGDIKEQNRKYINTNEDFCIKDVCINPFPIPHDAVDPVGFNFYIQNKKVTLATDIGHISDQLMLSLTGSDAILIESNHDVEMLKCGSYPYFLKRRILGENGHLSNEDAGKLIAYMAREGTSHFLLGHLSKENNFPELAYQTVYNALTDNMVKVGKDVLLCVAERSKTSTAYQL